MNKSYLRILHTEADAGAGAANASTTTQTAVDPAATQTGGAANNTATPPASQPTEWFQAFQNPENKNFAQVKNYKDPEMVVESARNLEKLLGAPRESLLRLPTDEKAPEWEQVYQRLGKPEKADGYGLEVPKEGGASKEFIDWAKDAFHKANLSTAQAKAVLDQWNGLSAAEATKAQEVANAKSAQEATDLKAAWGNAYEQNENIAKAGAREFGLTPEKIDAIQKTLGYKETMQLFHNIGSKLGEATFTDGGSKGFHALPPAMAQAQLESLKSDKEFMGKYANGDATAKAKMSKLFADAYPGEFSV